ncbi:MAG TPA: NAD(P)-dependent oxidoreductase [Actinomycetota bacterium]|nr:NAD(P)-dependent oxidoreductase [Actinomycetota bacterium]
MRVLLTGSGGGLGTAFAAAAGAEHEVIAYPRTRLAVEDRLGVHEAIAAARPDVVLNAAAMTSVDGCEVDPEAAYRANAFGARNVALAAAAAGALLIHVSTDYVFDGRKGAAYHEFDEPNPISVYGHSKLGGEREVTAHAADHLIVRTSWVFGSGRDYLSGALGRLARGESAPAMGDLVGTPTHVRHLAERLIPLVDAGYRGLVHLGGPEATTWHDVLLRAARDHSLPGEVVEQKAGDLDRPAARPPSSPLTSLVLRGDIPSMPPLAEAVREIVEGLDGGR